MLTLALFYQRVEQHVSRHVYNLGRGYIIKGELLLKSEIKRQKEGNKVKSMLHRGTSANGGSTEAIMSMPSFLDASHLRERLSALAKSYKLGALSLLFLIGGSLGVLVAGQYMSTSILSGAASETNILAVLPNKSSNLNKAIAQAGLQTELQQVTSQPAHLVVNGQPVTISPNTIKSWLSITSNSAKSEYDLHSNETAITNSLLNLANQQATAPVNEVVASPNGTQEVIVGGVNGTAVSNVADIKTQAQQLAKILLSGSGFNVNVSLATAPFQTLTPAAFPKLLQADTNTKKMYAYANGQLVQTFLISAGAPATPTPIGEFHIVQKLTVQDMSGYGPNGQYYFQPHVHWINYFYAGSAIHGVYWHPLSWFGVHNSSHGCVGVSESDAQWVYNWAPIGTTVITTLN
jgi:lipoprotein-anchoring transpeptidase ErfK/SrfK